MKRAAFPEVAREDGYRLCFDLFYSNEHDRPRVHVRHGEHEASIWLAPVVAWTKLPFDVPPATRKKMLDLATKYRAAALAEWQRHFPEMFSDV